jgi:hypothetical protein
VHTRSSHMIRTPVARLTQYWPRGALKKVDARNNNLDSKGKQALKKAAGSRCMCACQRVFNYKVLVLTHSPPS